MADTASYKRYANMQESNISWLGKTPKEWPFLRLKSIFQIQKNIVGELGHDVLSITQKGIKKKDTISGEGQLSMDYSKYQRVSPGDFAMNHMDLLTGYVDISKQHGVTSPDYRVFKLVHTESVPRYWLYVLQLCYKAKIFFPLGQGAAHIGRWRLPTEGFNQFVCVVPSIGEQQKIANFLDHQTAKIDTLIEKQQQLIKLLKEKRQAVISHAVTKGLNPDAPMKDSGVEWLGEVPQKWGISTLKHHCYINDGNHGEEYPTDRDFTDGENGVPFIRGSDLNDLYISSRNLRFITKEKNASMRKGGLQLDDVLFVNRGDIGQLAIVTPEFIGSNLNSQIAYLRSLARLSPKYLLYFLCSTGVKNLIDSMKFGSVLTQFPIGDIERIAICLPSPVEQEAIVKKLDQQCSKYLRLIDKSSNLIALMSERRTALISAAVTGKIDVRNWQPPTKQTTSSKDV